MKTNEYKKITYYENSLTFQHQEFIIAESHCVLCGTTLELDYIREQDSNILQEEAHCPQCQLKTRSQIYDIQ